MADKSDTCALCRESRADHFLANFSDGPHVGRAFLVCPRSVFVSVAEQERYQRDALNEARGAGGLGGAS